MTNKINKFAPWQGKYLGAPKQNCRSWLVQKDEQGSSGPVNAAREIVSYDRDWLRAPIGFSPIIGGVIFLTHVGSKSLRLANHRRSLDQDAAEPQWSRPTMVVLNDPGHGFVKLCLSGIMTMGASAWGLSGSRLFLATLAPCDYTKACTMKPELKATWTPAISVLTFFMLVTSILSVFTRLGTKYFMVRKWGLDDFMSIGAMFTCVGQSIAVSMATKSGLGQHLLSLSDGQRVSMMKAQYAANILFVASMACSKLALIMFIRSLTPATLDRRFALGLGVFILLWAVVGVFTAAFQCSLPDTWDYLHGKCFHLVAWWNYLGVTNILSEVGIVVQALLVILRIQADFHKKAVLASVFFLRVVVVIAIICQLAYARANENTSDPSWDTWTVAISTQMAQSLSIVTACSPQFKPFLDSLRSSGMSLGDSSYESKQRTYGATSYYKSSRSGRAGERRSDTHELVPIHGDGMNHTTVISTTDCDTESQSSQAQIIREVLTWTVTAQRE